MPYTSSLPNLTTPLTVSVFYYEPFIFSLDWGKPWPGRVGFRTTTVLSNSWPILTPAATRPSAVSISQMVIRWRNGDFTDSLDTSESPAPSVPLNPPTSLDPGSGAPGSSVPLNPRRDSTQAPGPRLRRSPLIPRHRPTQARGPPLPHCAHLALAVLQC